MASVPPPPFVKSSTNVEITSDEALKRAVEMAERNATPEAWATIAIALEWKHWNNMSAVALAEDF